MITSIKLFRITSRTTSKAVRADREQLFLGVTPAYPAHITTTSGSWYSYDPYYNYVISAVLTQEMNKGGSLEISVKKSIASKLLDVNNFIEVKSPYIVNNLHYSSKDDLQAYGATWVGRQAKRTIKSDRLTMIYEGELSWLESRILPPYTHTGTNIDFTDFIADTFSAQTLYGSSVTSPFPWHVMYSTASHSPCDIGPSATRSNIYLSTLWSEFEEKILKKYNNQVLLRARAGATYSEYERDLLIKPVSENDRGYIDENDILTASQSVDMADRHSGVFAYGEPNDPTIEGDSTRWRGSAAAGITNATNSSTHKAYVIGDGYASTATLNEKASAIMAMELADTQSIDMTLKPSKQEELNLGELYYIRHIPTGIDGYYRLTKRQVDLLNPTKNKLTFGATMNYTSRR